MHVRTNTEPGAQLPSYIFSSSLSLSLHRHFTIMSSLAPISIGIVGCANIARKLSRAIQLVPNAEVTALASRSSEKAAAFAKTNGLPPEAKIYGSYEELLDDPEIDAVYLPLPTSLHRRWAVHAAERKKHVLLEKPVALNVQELDEITEACDANGVQFMDCTMWMHHPRLQEMKDFLHDKQHFGQLRSVSSSFTFYAKPEFLENNIRVNPNLDALGALGDVGWYCIRAILWAADFKLPKTVVATEGPVLNQAGVILSCGASLHFENDVVATMHCSFLSHLTMTLSAIGTHGTLHLSDFNIPHQEHRASFTTWSGTAFSERETGWGPFPTDHVVANHLPQEALMVTEFVRLVRDVKTIGGKPDNKWRDMSRNTQLVLDAVKTSVHNGCDRVQLLA